MGYDSPYYRDLGMRELFDAQSWALIHYMTLGQGPEGSRRLTEITNRLAAGREPIMAFQEVVGNNLEAIDEDMAGYIRKQIYQFAKLELPEIDAKRVLAVAAIDEVAANAELGCLYLSTGSLEEAERRLSASVEARPAQVTAHEGLASLALERNEPPQALAHLGRAAANRSTNPFVYFRHAGILLDPYLGGTVSSIPADVSDAAAESLRKALELSPDFPEATGLFGFLSLFNDALIAESLPLVRRALGERPADIDLLMTLAQIYFAAKDDAAAKPIFESLLVRELEPWMVALARNRLDFIESR